MHCPKEAEGFIKPEYRDLPFLMHSNFEVSAELKERLRAVVNFAQQGRLCDAWDARCMHTLLQMQDECLASFAQNGASACCDRERKFK